MITCKNAPKLSIVAYITIEAQDMYRTKLNKFLEKLKKSNNPIKKPNKKDCIKKKYLPKLRIPSDTIFINNPPPS
jgi:hypothetical protein